MFFVPSQKFWGVRLAGCYLLFVVVVVVIVFVVVVVVVVVVFDDDHDDFFLFQVRSFGVLGWPGSHGETRAGGKPSIIHQPSLLP